MLITNHVLSGAVIGAGSPDVISAVTRGFLSHFVLDVVPHFGVDDEHFLKLAVADGLLGLAAIAAVGRTTPADQRLTVLAGVLGACLPDMDKPGRQFFGRSPYPDWFDRLHAAIQPESSRRLPVELAAAALFVAALQAAQRR